MCVRVCVLFTWVLGVGVVRERATPDGGAASGVGDDHAVSVHLSEQTDVGRLTTASTGT